MKSVQTILVVIFVAAAVLFGFSMAGFAKADKVATDSQQTMMTDQQMAHQELAKVETAVGKVTAVDPEGKAITISENIGGKEPLIVGTIVNDDTRVQVKGKKADLKDIKVGDTVRIHYVRSNDLYAKEIAKG